MKELLPKLINGDALTEAETFSVFEELMANERDAVTDAQIGAYLAATAARQITSPEIVGAVRSMRAHALAVDIKNKLPGVSLLDTAGTGGSGMQSFNTSTAAAFVIAAGGQPVAKHGNRAATSKSGSADVLAALGVNLNCTPQTIVDCIVETGFGFMFAPNHHPATKRVVGIRKELGFRTIFNFLGPLTNPAGADYQLVGISSKGMVLEIAEALLTLGTKGAMVVRGEDGLDEITLCSNTFVAEVRNSELHSYSIKPEDVGYQRRNFAEISGKSAEESAELIREIFSGKGSAYRELVAFNAGAAFYIAKKTATIAEGVRLAEKIIDSGAVTEVLERVIKLSNKP